MAISNAIELYDALNILSDQTEELAYIWRKGGFIPTGSINDDLLNQCNTFINNIVENIAPMGLRSAWFFDHTKKYMGIILEKNRIFDITYEITPNDIENLLRSFDHNKTSLIDESHKNNLKKSIYDAYQKALDSIDDIIDEYIVKISELLTSFGFIVEESSKSFGKILLLKYTPV